MSNDSKLAVVFLGQGSQTLEMSNGLIEIKADIKETFENLSNCNRYNCMVRRVGATVVHEWNITRKRLEYIFEEHDFPVIEKCMENSELMEVGDITTFKHHSDNVLIIVKRSK